MVAKLATVGLTWTSNLLLLFFIAISHLNLSSAMDIIEVSFGGDKFGVVEAFSEKQINLTVTCTTQNGGRLHFESDDESIFMVISNTSNFECLPANKIINETFSLFVKGVALGVADLRTVFTNSTGHYDIDMYLIKVLRKPLLDSIVLAIVLVIWICVSYITMGSKIDLQLIWKHLKRPHGVLIGLLCQFLIMPPLSFGLAKLFALDDAAAIGLILDGTCPGGWFSNVFTLLLNCDFNLSLTMTFCSTILALGMMPLNLFIYTRFFLDKNEQLRAPYSELAMQLAFLIVPVLIGLGLSNKFPKVKRIFDKMLRPMLAGLIVLSLGVGIPTQYYVVQASWRIWVASAVFPLIGGALGFTIARVTRLDVNSAITIAIETGVQNSMLAIAVVALYYDQPETDLIGRVPALIGLLVVMEGGLMAVVKEVRGYYKKRKSAPYAIYLQEDGEISIKGSALSAIRLDSTDANGTEESSDEPECQV